jgi:hypothetical protein
MVQKTGKNTKERKLICFSPSYKAAEHFDSDLTPRVYHRLVTYSIRKNQHSELSPTENDDKSRVFSLNFCSKNVGNRKINGHMAIKLFGRYCSSKGAPQN